MLQVRCHCGKHHLLARRRQACKDYQNKILFSIAAHPSGAFVLPTRCTTDISIATVL